jgi:hypothetical protein
MSGMFSWMTNGSSTHIVTTRHARYIPPLSYSPSLASFHMYSSAADFVALLLPLLHLARRGEWVRAEGGR